MREVLQGLLITGAACLALCVLGVAWVRHRLRRRLRITPAVRSAAPTMWLVAPTTGARLHLRLRRVGASARAASALDPALASLADELVADAVSLEPVLVALAKSGRTRAPVRRRLSAQVSELETVARRLTSLSIRAVERPSEPVSLRDRVEVLAAARQEVADLDAAAGLRSPA